MKRYFKSVMLANLLVLAISFMACEKEYDPIVETNEEETMTANSAAATLIANMVSNDGSFDNIVDGSSCFDILFPYTVSINGSDLTINSKDDLLVIEEILDAFDGDNAILDIVFPVTITLSDYSEISVENISQLREHSAECVEGGGDADIECIDVIYPVTFFTFDLQLRQTGTVGVESDWEMRRFLAGLDIEDIVSLQFPIVFQMFDGEKMTVTNMQELGEAIAQAREACDEDDDNDHNDDDFTKVGLDNLLVKCPWSVNQLSRRNQNGTEHYKNYLMNFSDGGAVTLVVADLDDKKDEDDEGILYNGEWTTRFSDNRVRLDLEFESLEDFNLEWLVWDIDGARIKLFAGDGDHIILKTTCDASSEVCDADFIEKNLSTCEWSVINEEGTSLEDLNLDFSNKNIHVKNPNGGIEDEGNWSVIDEGLIFNDLSLTFANYIGEWIVVECASDRFKMKRGDEYLIIEKECD